MPDGDEVKFKSPTTGVEQVVPPEQWEEALKQGYKPTTHSVMYSPDGQRGMVPNAERYAKTQAGFTDQPKTQFERERSEGTGRGFLAHAGDALKSLVGGVANMPLSPSEAISSIPAQAGQMGLDAANRQAEGRSKAYQVAAPLAQLVVPGLRPRAMEEAANAGDTAGVLGEAAVPVAATLGGAALGEAPRARAALRDAAFKELPTTGGPQLTKGARATSMLFGSGVGAVGGAVSGVPGGTYIGGHAGLLLGPSLVERILGAPELGDIRNPGLFSKIPMRAPKTPLAVKPTPDPSPILSPSSDIAGPRPTGSEGRAATWPNDKVLNEAARGNRVAIEQANRRGLDLPPNARYVMGDPDLPRAVYNPKETTIFSPEGTPIRNVDNPTVKAPRERITVPQESTTQEPPRPQLNFEQATPVPSETPLSEAVQPQQPRPLAVRAGVGRRQADIDYQQAIQSTPPGTPTPGEQLSEDIRQARAGQPSGTSEGEALQTIMRDPDRYEQYKTADQKTRDRMLIAAKNEIATPASNPLAVQPSLPRAEEEPVEIEIKGITAPKSKRPLGLNPKPKPIAIDRRFSPEEITDAEGLLASEAGAMSSADRLGVYFDESEAGDVRLRSRGAQFKGGDWRGVKSGRDMYPFMREHPEWGPEAVQKALRNKDSAAYRKMMEAAIEFVNRDKNLEADERTAIQEE